MPVEANFLEAAQHVKGELAGLIDSAVEIVALVTRLTMYPLKTGDRFLLTRAIRDLEASFGPIASSLYSEIQKLREIERKFEGRGRWLDIKKRNS
jgi:hypothetical protein